MNQPRTQPPAPTAQAPQRGPASAAKSLLLLHFRDLSNANTRPQAVAALMSARNTQTDTWLWPVPALVEAVRHLHLDASIESLINQYAEARERLDGFRWPKPE